MKNIGISVVKTTLLAAIGLVVAGCANYRSVETAVEQAQVPELSHNFKQASQISDAEPVFNWWQQLEDAPLSTLVDRALSVNHDLRIALAAVNESRAILRREKLEYIPSVTANVQSTREKQSAELTGTNSTINEYHQGGFNVSWEVDLFGRIGNQVKLSNAQLNAREADVKAVQVALAAEVASVYLRLRGIQQLIDIAERSVSLQEQNLQLVERFLSVGRGTEFDLARAKSQLQLTAARLPTLQQDYRIGLNRLSVLTVQPIESIESLIDDANALPSIPPSVAVGRPEELLKRRPDILQAEYSLQGAIAEYNIHVADMYPQISLSGSFGYLSSEWSQLGREETETFWFSPTIRWAALDLTRVKARIDAADARTQSQLANFEKTVLTALQETEDAITRFSKEEQRAQRLKVAATESAKAARFAQKTYQIGSGDLRDVLDAEQVRLNAAQQLVQSEITILLNLVDIYKNLGGGWDIASS